MKATIDRTGCIGCGLCPDICPEVFQMADDGLAEVIAAEIPTDAEGTGSRRKLPRFRDRCGIS